MTKVISLQPDGMLKADGSHCKLWEGTAERLPLTRAGDLAEVIKGLQSNQAISLGRLRSNLLSSVAIVTKANLPTSPDSIARTSEFIGYGKGVPALASLDIDTKGMPPEMRERIKAAGGYWPALRGIISELKTCAYIQRSSTSSWIYRMDTNPAQWVTEDSGVHFYVLVTDAPMSRLLEDFAARCWLHGFGWMMIGAGGQLLTRSLIDRSVGRPEGLMFRRAAVPA